MSQRIADVGSAAIARLRLNAERPVGRDLSTRDSKIALVNMPFGSTRYPSIQLGLLQSILKRADIDTRSFYLNLSFAAQIGWERYEALCGLRCHGLGEWIFARAAFGEDAPDGRDFLATFADEVAKACAEFDFDESWLIDLREQLAPAFITESLEAIPWDDYRIVGFGSVFEQNCAALALARRIKQRFPTLVTVFGGANFEDEMGLEYVRSLPWVDYAVIGEADEVLPELVARILGNHSVVGMPGVAARESGVVRFCGRAPLVRDLDALPNLDYDDYFAAASKLQVPATVLRRQTQVPFESARGCWWGAKHQCTFCGLNGVNIGYRSKSPDRVLSEIHDLAARYRVYNIEAVDNILDQRYVDTVFASLGAGHYDYNLFYEVKANLTPEQLRVLARAGVQRLQPGIESLSSHVLALMDKGTTALQNVRLLKWSLYHGISVAWNVLLGFPGETVEDYAEQLALMRLIPHLQPPDGVGRIWLERFSPYFGRADAAGIKNVRPDRGYAHIYPAGIDLARIAYFFEYDAPDTLPDNAHDELRQQVRSWRDAWSSERRPFLACVRTSGHLSVLDGRNPNALRTHDFDELAALVYEYCSLSFHTAPQTLAYLQSGSHVDANRQAVQRCLDDFTAQGLMVQEMGRYFSLAVPVNPNW